MDTERTENPQLYNYSQMHVDLCTCTCSKNNALEWLELSLGTVLFVCLLCQVALWSCILLHLNSRFFNKKQKYSDWERERMGGEREGEKKQSLHWFYSLILWDTWSFIFVIGVSVLYVQSTFQNKSWLQSVHWSTISEDRETNLEISFLEHKYAKINFYKVIDKFVEIQSQNLKLWYNFKCKPTQSIISPFEKNILRLVFFLFLFKFFFVVHIIYIFLTIIVV